MLDNSIQNNKNTLPELRGLKVKKNLSLNGRDMRGYLVKSDNQNFYDKHAASVRGMVKCVYVDPPYNNLDNFFDYSDSDSHEEWLHVTSTHIYNMWSLLREDGSIWISIDDRQVHYLKVALDNLIGRGNFVSSIVWEHRKTRENRKVFSNNHEYILVYCKNQQMFKSARNHLPADSDLISRYKNPDRDPRGPWQSISLNVQAGHATTSQFYELISPSGIIHSPPNGRCWVYSENRMRAMMDDNRLWFGKRGDAVPRLKKFLAESRIGLTPHTLWKAEEVGTTDSAKKDFLSMFPNIPVFDTPKPESLIRRILEIATDADDLVIDSYLGSGTTAAVALKTGRRFIGVEKADRAIGIASERMRMWAETTIRSASESDFGFIYGEIR